MLNCSMYWGAIAHLWCPRGSCRAEASGSCIGGEISNVQDNEIPSGYHLGEHIIRRMRGALDESVAVLEYSPAISMRVLYCHGGVSDEHVLCEDV